MKELTILMPCLNEAETIGMCIRRARKLLSDHGIDGEILVSDNGSTDGSRGIAAGLGARVIECPVRGYGAALQCGIEQAEGEFILMGDSDDSYHFDDAFPMIRKLREGADICMGTRLRGTIVPGAMPALNRYLGNPLLTAIGRIFFGIRLSDFHCGIRAFRREPILALNLVTTGMEWASEMIIKARLANLSMTEIPVTLFRDGRSRPPHLKRWSDGWRHLRFMLLHSPRWLFLYPGITMILVGLTGELILMQGMYTIGDVSFDVHTLLVMAFVLILGFQTICTGIFARLYCFLSGILPWDPKFDRFMKGLTLERVLIACIVVGAMGTAGFLYTLIEWYRVNFSELNYQVTMRQLVPSLTCIVLAVLGIFNSFMVSILFLKTKKAGLPSADKKGTGP